jgi:hypothetical protein
MKVPIPLPLAGYSVLLERAAPIEYGRRHVGNLIYQGDQAGFPECPSLVFDEEDWLDQHAIFFALDSYSADSCCIFEDLQATQMNLSWWRKRGAR